MGVPLEQHDSRCWEFSICEAEQHDSRCWEFGTCETRRVCQARAHGARGASPRKRRGEVPSLEAPSPPRCPDAVAWTSWRWQGVASAGGGRTGGAHSEGTAQKRAGPAGGGGASEVDLHGVRGVRRQHSKGGKRQGVAHFLYADFRGASFFEVSSRVLICLGSWFCLDSCTSRSTNVW